MKHKFPILLFVILLILFSQPVLAQEITPTVSPDTAPIVVSQTPLDWTVFLEIVMPLVAFVFIIIRSVLDYRQNHNVLQAYGNLIQGLVTNQPLSDSLSKQYQSLPESKRRYADLAMEMMDDISRATPTTVDDVIQTWTARIRSQTTGVSQNSG